MQQPEDAQQTRPTQAGGDAAHPLGDGRTLEQILSSQRLENLGRLAAGIAHDFNNVLGVILGYVELAKMTGGSDSTTRHLDQALSTIGRARTLADRLMELARGGVRDEESGDLNVVVEEIRELLSETADRRVDVRLHLANDTPWLPTAPEHLAQVVLNLAVNALDAMGSEPGQLVIETGRSEIGADDPSGLAPGTYARLRVRDTGPGIPTAQRGQIFEPYFSTRSDGTGLGLWAVRRIVEHAGGAITIDDAVKGAQFTVLLPSEPNDGDAPADETQRASQGERILIVDDEAGVRDVTRSYLEAAGYDVVEAETGEDGLALIERGPGSVDLVLLDLQLSDISGREMAQRISGLPGGPNIVVMTGDVGSGAVERLPQVGKPFLRQDLLDAVQSALETPESPQRET